MYQLVPRTTISYREKQIVKHEMNKGIELDMTNELQIYIDLYIK